ncbi:GAF domain-containing protein [Ciceribacter thiooxidans]|uniref:GAF domain-containing protein n=1 Tax=Ciceribacter thiooxidans TaxID=1969821 RepID=A0ABV7I5D5_9HYPH|nr:GAF domain-containing protein [Ciceribacter thiooxidans]
MPRQPNHSDLVYHTASQSSAAASSPIVASWRRCLDLHQLQPEESRKPERVEEAVFRSARERAGHLVSACSEEVDRLYQTVGRSGCCILLSDRDGVVLDRRGAAGDDADFRELGLWPQAVWSEASVGTNGIGTALADQRPVMIHRDQHFLSANTELSCVTAPIRDHLGRVTAALDISTCRNDVTDMALAILSQAVRDAAVRVEATLFRLAFPGARIVMVPAASAGSVALLAVDGDDLVLGATRAARLALKLDDQRIAQGLPASDALCEGRGEGAADLGEAERAALRRALSRTNGNVSQAAQVLGISRATLHRKMKRFALQ